MTPLDLDFLAKDYPVLVNGEPYDGRIVVGDIVTVNGFDYIIQALNEDCVLAKEIPK